MTDIVNIPADRLVAGDNDRWTFDAAALRELADSIATHGLAQNPVVRPHPTEANTWEIVAGERRCRAMRDVLEWETIPCIVRDLDDEAAAAIMLAENTGRVDLNPIEEAQAYQRRIDRFGWTRARIAEAAGVHVSQVIARLRLLELEEDVQHYVRVGQFPANFADVLSALDANRQRIAMRAYNRAQTMPLHRWRDIVRKLRDDQDAEAQQPLFTLELKIMEVVETNDDRPSKGRDARTGAPAGRDLPPVRWSQDWRSMARVLDGYIHDLMEMGHMEGAAAVANVYNVFVAHGYVFVPDDATLPRMTDAGTVGEELHESAV